MKGKDYQDWCKFIRDIEADPLAPCPPMTVREYWDLVEHTQSCDSCHVIVERIAAMADEMDKKNTQKQFPGASEIKEN